MRARIRLLTSVALAAALSAGAAGSAAAATSVVVTTASPPPHTAVNTPYVADGRLLTVDDADGDEVDVRITLDRGTVALGAAPDADVVDPGGDRDARVIGTPAEVKPALDGIVITPDTDDQREITGAVWVHQNGSMVAGSSLRVIVDDGAPSGSCTPATGGGSAVNQAPTITAPAEVSAESRRPYSFGGSIAIADPDAADGQLKVRLTVPDAWWGDFTLPQRSGLTFTQGDGITDYQVEFCGTLSALNAALAELRFTPGFNDGGHETFTMTVDDLGNSGTGGPRTASTTVGVYVGPAGPRLTVASPPPHTPFNTPYVSNGELLAVDDIDGDEVDVRITLDRGTIALGAAPDANVVDPGGDSDARVIGTPAQVKPALDGIVITPDTDDQQEITGAVWVFQNGSAVAGHSLQLIVDAPVTDHTPHTGDGGQTDRRADDVAPLPTAERGSETAAAVRPIARASATRAGQRVKLSARGSKARRGRIVSYRWTGPGGRVLSRKATLWLRVPKRMKVTLAVVDSDGRTARTTLVVKPGAKAAGRA